MAVLFLKSIPIFLRYRLKLLQKNDTMLVVALKQSRMEKEDMCRNIDEII